MQIHLLELPKYVLPSDNREIVDPIEQWCYFFLRASASTAGEIARRLPNPAFAEATGVLEVIARDPTQRSLYEARLKAERDARAKEDYAREEGREQGLSKAMSKAAKWVNWRVKQDLSPFSKDWPTNRFSRWMSSRAWGQRD